jgi:hypothetical protein
MFRGARIVLPSFAFSQSEANAVLSAIRFPQNLHKSGDHAANVDVKQGDPVSEPFFSPNRAHTSAESHGHWLGDTSAASQPLQPPQPSATACSQRAQTSNGHVKDDPKGLAPTASPDVDGGYNCNGVEGKADGKTGDAQPHQAAAESLKTKLRRDALRTRFLAASGHLSEDEVRACCCRELCFSASEHLSGKQARV